MPQKQNPEPLAGGLGAGIRYAEFATDARAHLISQATRRLRRQYLAQRVHTLGARVLFQLIDELDRHHGLGDDLDQRLERYAAVDPELLRALGADTFPALPLRLVGVAR
jgi:hypothetical protein